MISKLKLLERYLNLLLLFLIPTQLALHFWPDFAFIFGIRVDYLSPAVYMTDILFLALFALWVFRQRDKIWADAKKARYFLLLLFIVAVLNTAFSLSSVVSVIKWLKIVELVALGYYVKEREDVFNPSITISTLFYSLILFSLVGILQFFKGGTLGNFLYFLGERSFSIFTPGIAIVNLLGKIFLRAYSTFPHPNSFAGFLGASLIFFASKHFKAPKLVKLFGFLVLALAFTLTFSLSAYIAIGLCFIFYTVFRKHLFNIRLFSFLTILVLLLSLYFSFFSVSILRTNVNFSQSFRQRLELGSIAGKIFSGNWITGSGLNTFIINEASYGVSERGVWLLQPVHNIYLLIFAESGLIGIALVLIFVFRLLKTNIKAKNAPALIVFVFILTTGLFDHYWFTIQQNLLLLSFFFGISFREKN